MGTDSIVDPPLSERRSKPQCGTLTWPYKLKQLIDLVAQRNYLFTYDGKQYGPLLKVERAIAVYTRGSRYLEGTPIPRLRSPGTLFGLLVAPGRCSRPSEHDC